ncbi:MAG: VCBS repeat-containing protein, partial [Pyrinomonadaceae bacterium]|nr:VCBS repeat-containing protein [Pyrinomonadaceae bacterium]
MRKNFLAVCLFLFIFSAFFANAQTTPTAQVRLGYNDVNSSQLLVWDATLTAVGWYITPAVPFSLTGVQTNFNAIQQTGSQDRNVTVEVLTDRRAAGGTLLRSVVFNTSTARGRLGGVNFAPVTLNAGTRYFIGFRGIAGIGINTTTDAGAVNCGACLYLDNQSSAEGQYATRGGTSQPSAQDQPIIRLVGTPVGNGNGSSRNYDFDGDGRSDFAVFRPSNGTWYLQNSTSGFSGLAFGASSDIPAAGDFDGDGRTD